MYFIFGGYYKLIYVVKKSVTILKKPADLDLH